MIMMEKYGIEKNLAFPYLCLVEVRKQNENLFYLVEKKNEKMKNLVGIDL